MCQSLGVSPPQVIAALDTIKDPGDNPLYLTTPPGNQDLQIPELFASQGSAMLSRQGETVFQALWATRLCCNPAMLHADGALRSMDSCATDKLSGGH